MNSFFLFYLENENILHFLEGTTQNPVPQGFELVGSW